MIPFFHQDFSPKAAAGEQKSLAMHFQNVQCIFSSGFHAEGRRGRAKKLSNSNMGINMAINIAYIYIYIYKSNIKSYINSLLSP